MKKLLFFLGVMLMCITSCTSENDPVPVATASEESATSAAKRIADLVMKDFGFQTSSRSDAEADVQVWCSDYLRMDTTAIIVNYRDGGFVLVNPDMTAESQIYAVSDEGSYIVGQNPIADEYIYGLTGLGDATIGRGDNDTLPKVPDLGIPVIMVKPDDIYKNYPTPNWHQDAPFNKYCFTASGAQAQVGCVALSMGQICSYYKYPSIIDGKTINWDSILSSNYIEDVPDEDVDVLAYFLYKLGVYCKMNYGVTESGATIDNALAAWKTIGYREVTIINSTSSLKEALKTGPAQIFSRDIYYHAGHAWVADGYKCTYTYIPPGIGIDGEIIREQYIPNEYFHFNWGWGGQGNAYYKLGEKYSAGNFTFSANVQAIVNFKL